MDDVAEVKLAWVNSEDTQRIEVRLQALLAGPVPIKWSMKLNLQVGRSEQAAILPAPHK